MKVVLLNKNTAVSRLIGLSVNKLGYQFLEVENVDELPQDIDILIVDDEIEKFSQLVDRAKHTIFLVSKNSNDLPVGGEILQKPFLPTKFIEIVESFKPAENIEDSDLGELGIDDEIVLENIENDEVKDEPKDENLPKSENLEQNDTNEIEEISNIIDEIDQMEDNSELKSDEVQILEPKIDEAENSNSQNLEPKIEDLPDLPNDENSNSGEISTDENFSENSKNLDEISDENTQNNGYTQDIAQEPEEGIEEIANDQTDELNLDEDLQDKPNESSSNNENLDEIMPISEETQNEQNGENLDDKSIENEIVDNDLGSEIEEILHSKKDESLNEASATDDENSQQGGDDLDTNFDENLKADKKNQEDQNSFEESNIDNLSEREIKIALNEEVEEISKELPNSVKEPKSDNLKENIANKISQEIHSSISESSIKEALKDMKININITFEDKN